MGTHSGSGGFAAPAANQTQQPVTQIQPDGRTYSWGHSAPSWPPHRLLGLGEAEGLQAKWVRTKLSHPAKEGGLNRGLSKTGR